MAKVKKTVSTGNYIEKVEKEISSNQSKVSMILGALIVLVIGILIFNYFNRNKADLGPAQQTQQQPQQTPQPDVAQDKLPGTYTVKEGDTLFIVAEKYYQDGSKYQELAKANNLTNPDEIETGQVLQIPKPETQQTQKVAAEDTGTGGGNTTIWGPKIEGSSYTVVEDDWLSKIAGRAYGDIYAYDRITKANNIPNPNHIEPGMVLNLPR